MPGLTEPNAMPSWNTLKARSPAATPRSRFRSSPGSQHRIAGSHASGDSSFIYLYHLSGGIFAHEWYYWCRGLEVSGGLLLELSDRGLGKGDSDYGGAVEAPGYCFVKMLHVPWQESLTEQAQCFDLFIAIFYLLTSTHGYG